MGREKREASYSLRYLFYMIAVQFRKTVRLDLTNGMSSAGRCAESKVARTVTKFDYNNSKSVLKLYQLKVGGHTAT
jgi:hypothetical protein